MGITAITIKFSNINGSAGTSAKPGEILTATVNGKSVDGVAMVKVSDLAVKLGGTAIMSDTVWKIIRNGQVLAFTKNSTTMTAMFVYNLYNIESNKYDQYSHQWTALLPKAAQIIENENYVPVYMAAMQLGALMVTDIQNNVVTVFDFRVNGSNGAYEDNNIYIVGGSWLKDWSNKGSTKVAPHFNVNELWDKSSTTGARQLKVAIGLLESMERVRYYYNNNSAMTVEVCFRSWQWNKSISGSGANSFHMRGRAYDAPKDELYGLVKKEFSAGLTNPIDVSTAFWRTRNYPNNNSHGYEMEKMASTGNIWLHIQTVPGLDEATLYP